MRSICWAAPNLVRPDQLAHLGIVSGIPDLDLLPVPIVHFRLSLPQRFPAQRHQPDQILFHGEQFLLEPVRGRGQRPRFQICQWQNKGVAAILIGVIVLKTGRYLFNPVDTR